MIGWLASAALYGAGLYALCELSRDFIIRSRKTRLFLVLVFWPIVVPACAVADLYDWLKK